jgi:hypothetical protein
VTEPAAPSHALILDIDGVVSPVHPAGSPWGALVSAGNVFGPVLVAPAMCERLDALGRRPGVSCWWLTSWTEEMRRAMDPFPGRAWPVVGSLDDHQGPGRSWWKMAAMQEWVAQHPTVRSVAWCDDHLRGGRPAAARRWFASRDVEALLVAPTTSVGLTPAHLDQLEEWANSATPPVP